MVLVPRTEIAGDGAGRSAELRGPELTEGLPIARHCWSLAGKAGAGLWWAALLNWVMRTTDRHDPRRAYAP